MKKMSFLLAVLAMAAPAGADELALTLISVKKIWDQAEHNAFTDLLRYHGHWYCTFREAKGHAVQPGAVRILTSRDGNRWSSAVVLRESGLDARDPKLSITPDDRLMLNSAVAIKRDMKNPDSTLNVQSMVWFSKDGHKWSEGIEVGEQDYWLWRVAWHKGRALGVGYRYGNTAETKRHRHNRLYESEDGVKYKTLVKTLLEAPEEGSEATLRFLDDDRALCLFRRNSTTAALGLAKPPYTEWTWKFLNEYIGGPNMIQAPNGRWIAAGRGYRDGAKTVIWELDIDRGKLRPLIVLPSGGDTSYPGLAWHGEELWVSYYSSHEGKTSIYLAKLRLSQGGQNE